MKEKNEIARDYIISLLEKGGLKEGEQLPGARDISKKLNISFLIVQNAISTLVQENVIQTFPRKGTFVNKGWREQVLSSNVRTVYPGNKWFGDFKALVEGISPELRVCSGFEKGMFEIRTTLMSQALQYEYLDLSEIYASLCPDRTEFYLSAATPFQTGHKLFGIPFSFSPRVLFYNRRILEKAGEEIPPSIRTWDEFIERIKYFREKLPGVEMFNWQADINVWMNVVMRSGGSLILHDGGDPVKLDSPETMRGLKRWGNLRKMTMTDVFSPGYDFREKFMDGKLLFFFGSRMSVMHFREKDFTSWGTMPLPLIEKDCDLTTQATEVLCVRKECPLEKAELFIRTMLSAPVQDFIGKLPYGIPFRKSSAAKNYHPEDRADALFFSEMPKMRAWYLMDYSSFYEIISAGVRYLWTRPEDEFESTVKEIANTLRTLVKIGIRPKI